MSTAVLMQLRDYLYGTLTPDDMRWLATQLTKYAEKEEYSLKPFTMEELNARIDEAEADIDAGRVISDEDMWRELEEEFAREDSEADARLAFSSVDELQMATL